MTWLTRLAVDPRHGEALRDLADATRMHQRVMSLLPDNLGPNARQQTNTLYRIDDTAAGTHILIQTEPHPDLRKLPACYTPQTRELDPFLDTLANGQLIRYRITANPSKRHGRTSDTPGKIQPLTGHDAETWWHRRATESGLHIHTITTTSQPPTHGAATPQKARELQERGKKPKAVRYTTTRFDGTATITNTETLRHALTTGIGRGQSYGCGLLSIAHTT